MTEGRVLIYPRAIAFGARPLEVPRRGPVLCASAIVPFRVADGEILTPEDWYRAVAAHGGANTIPDAMAPLANAEVLLLGALAPLGREERREARIRCGALERAFVLRAGPEDAGDGLRTGPDAACWHAEDNPGGRGGPGDERTPLILDPANPSRALWLGPTPFDHPARLRRIGTPTEASGTGWPHDASEEALNDAHEAFWTDPPQPGDPLEWEGLTSEPVRGALPPYRVSITSVRADARLVCEAARIHTVMLIPAAGAAAAIWRAGITLAHDPLGEAVTLLIAALEDARSPMRDAEHWGAIAFERLADPARALDDRPLLPPALATAAAVPLADLGSGGDGAGAVAAARAWASEEAGLPDTNPFTHGEAEALEAKVRDAMRDGPPDGETVAEIADAALAQAKERHAAAGFAEPPEEDEARRPERRGSALGAEIECRFGAPYAHPRERALARELDRASAGAGTQSATEVLEKLAHARMQSPHPPLPWAALEAGEARRFGDALVERLSAGAVARHVDASGAHIDHGAPDGEPPGPLAGHRIEGLLAEETTWTEVAFGDCVFAGTSFANARFERCRFVRCTFEDTNLSGATLDGCAFVECTLEKLRPIEPVWMDTRFDRCTLSGVSLLEPALRDVSFTGGTWREVELSEGLVVGLAVEGARMDEVTFASTHSPNARFERVTMHKVWALGKGFPGSRFEEVEAATCGFLGGCHFDEAVFARTRFTRTGFTNAVFTSATLGPQAAFDVCDFTGAGFERADCAGTRFLNCPMTASHWNGASAPGAWFMGSMLRGVDFADTELAGAVFADADLEGAKMAPERTIGADFRGALGREG